MKQLTPPPRSDAPVFLIDVDNTLLDNDRFGADLGARLEASFGTAARGRYWDLFEALRSELGYADYLGALQRFRSGLGDQPALLLMSSFLLDYPFHERLYPGALEAIDHLRAIGRPVILSDGDIVFQPRKIQRSGLWAALRGEVLICTHKERELDAVQTRFPSAHYVMIDDKARLLASMKRTLGAQLSTVFVKQGKYAAAGDGGQDPAPDLSIETIGVLRDLTLGDFRLSPRRGEGP